MTFIAFAVVMLIIIAVIYLFYDKTILEYNKRDKEDVNIIHDTHVKETVIKHKNRKESKGQRIVREYLEKRFNKEFIECRPDFLKNPKTGKNLEYDCYNEELGLAVEYNGKQHYELTSIFHKSPTDFQNQVLRDNIKVKLSEKNDICLIIVPYNIKHNDIPDYLEEKLIMCGY